MIADFRDAAGGWLNLILGALTGAAFICAAPYALAFFFIAFGGAP